MRYTGWTVPTYNQSQQQYGYAAGQPGYNMNSYPQGQGPQAYQGAPGAPQNSGAAYYDASQPAGAGSNPWRRR